MRLRNHSKRALSLPLRPAPAGGKTERFSVVVPPRGEADAPRWYVDELRKEPGPAARLSSGELSVGGADGPTDKSEPEQAPRGDDPWGLKGRSRQELRDLARELGVAEQVDLSAGAADIRTQMAAALDAEG